MFRIIVSNARSRLYIAHSHHLWRQAPIALLARPIPSRRWASGITLASSTTDPASTESLKALEEGTQKLEEGDVVAAKALYERSLQIRKTPSALFNYGVTCYHLKDFQGAIDAWKESIELQPDSPDAHTNLASAYIMTPISRPDLAIQHLREAARLSPEDAEIAFNLGAVLEAAGNLEEALEQYNRSRDFGVEKAAMHVRNVSAKILGKRLRAAGGAEEPEPPKRTSDQ